MRESITISIRPTSLFTCTRAVFNLFHTDHHQPDTTLPQLEHIYAVLAARICGPRHALHFPSQTSVFFASAFFFFFFFCTQRLRLPGRRQLDEMLYPPDCWEEALKHFRFSSILRTAADRCSKRRLPGLVSSLYSRQLTRPHYITIRLPLKVILPEHNHTQSKPQTS